MSEHYPFHNLPPADDWHPMTVEAVKADMARRQPWRAKPPQPLPQRNTRDLYADIVTFWDSFPLGREGYDPYNHVGRLVLAGVGFVQRGVTHGTWPQQYGRASRYRK